MKKSLNIIHLISSLEGGGMEFFVIRLAKAQQDDGHDLKILSVNVGPLFDLAKDMGLDATVLQASSINGRLYNLIKSVIFRPCDIIHVHNPTTLQYGLIAKSLTASKLICTDHAQTRGIVRMPRKFEWKFVDKLIAVSRDTAQKTHLLGYNGIPQVIYNGIGTTVPQQNRNKVRKELGIKDEVVLINVAGLLYVKGQDILLKSLKRLESEKLNYKLLIVGKGPEEKNLKELVLKLGLPANRIKFLGFRKDAIDLLNGSDIFVLPSRNEGLPISILEAMSLKLPVIVSDAGGNNELVADETHGYIVEKENDIELAEKLELLINNTKLRHKMGQEGFNHVNINFSFSSMVSKYSDVYYTSLGMTK